jgi:hypothetical protein
MLQRVKKVKVKKASTDGSCLQSLLLRRQRSGGKQCTVSPRQIIHKTLFRENPSQKKPVVVAQAVRVPA